MHRMYKLALQQEIPAKSEDQKKLRTRTLCMKAVALLIECILTAVAVAFATPFFTSLVLYIAAAAIIFSAPPFSRSGY
ncbi:hypothetical protein [Candidatus Ichthyocystis hellenicum]|uniref:hypothetical protein n=1 Tax=Candidatus Ichthyocystis hellenicum TaxID=1561003 RepID=UPI000B880F68|nr:hypothetical protein [Candidatus Ichthyocystis hellenicum]